MEELFWCFYILLSGIFYLLFYSLFKLLLILDTNWHLSNRFLTEIHKTYFKCILASRFKVLFLNRIFNIIFKLFIKDIFTFFLNLLTLFLTHIIPSILYVWNSSFIYGPNIRYHHVTVHFTIQLFTIQSFNFKSLSNSFSKLKNLSSKFWSKIVKRYGI